MESLSQRFLEYIEKKTTCQVDMSKIRILKVIQNILSNSELHKNNETSHIRIYAQHGDWWRKKFAHRSFGGGSFREGGVTFDYDVT